MYFEKLNLREKKKKNVHSRVEETYATASFL